MVELVFRTWTHEDEPFLWDMLHQSLHVRPGQPAHPRSVLQDPAIAHYLSDFGQRDGDDAHVCVTTDGERIGAAWVRRMTADDPGYGYVSDGVPEVGMAVVAEWRGRGVGRRLLDALLARHPSMSLSVDDDNVGAAGLYRSLGFVAVASDAGSTTMYRHGAGPAPVPSVHLRRATARDAEPAARLLVAARRAAVPSIPPPVHADDEIVQWFCGPVMATTEVWLAERDPGLVGVMVLSPGWIEQLYVDPDHTGEGIGALLVDLAKQRATSRIDLWTFESNLGAQRFYQRHGFVEVARTDGDNEEGQPDIRYRWSEPGRADQPAGPPGGRGA